MQRLVVSHGLDGSCVSIGPVSLRNGNIIASSPLLYVPISFEFRSTHTRPWPHKYTHKPYLEPIKQKFLPSQHYSTNFLQMFFYGRLLLLIIMTKSIGICFSCLSLQLYESLCFLAKDSSEHILFDWSSQFHPTIHPSIDSC